MNIVKDYQNWRKYRRTVNQLRSLPDSLLSDIGVNRHSINDFARQVSDN